MLDASDDNATLLPVWSRRRSADDFIDADSRFTDRRRSECAFQAGWYRPWSAAARQRLVAARIRLGGGAVVVVVRRDPPDLPGFGLTGRGRTATTASRRMRNRCGVPGFPRVGRLRWWAIAGWQRRVEFRAGLAAAGAAAGADQCDRLPGQVAAVGLRLARNPATRALLRRVAPRSAPSAICGRRWGPGSAIVDETMVDRVHAMLMRSGNRDAFIDFANTDQIDRAGEIPRITSPTLISAQRHDRRPAPSPRYRA